MEVKRRLKKIVLGVALPLLILSIAAISVNLSVYADNCSPGPISATVFNVRGDTSGISGQIYVCATDPNTPWIFNWELIGPKGLVNIGGSSQNFGSATLPFWCQMLTFQGYPWGQGSGNYNCEFYVGYVGTSNSFTTNSGYFWIGQ